MSTPSVSHEASVEQWAMNLLAPCRWSPNGAQPELNEWTALTLKLDHQTIDLELDVKSGSLHLSALVCPVPSRSTEQVYRNLLVANLFLIGGNGATLAIDPVRDDIVLCQRLDQNSLKVDSFEGILEAFAASVRHWQDIFISGQIWKTQTRVKGSQLSAMADRA